MRLRVICQGQLYLAAAGDYVWDLSPAAPLALAYTRTTLRDCHGSYLACFFLFVALSDTALIWLGLLAE